MERVIKQEAPAVHFEQLIKRGCGLDVHEKNVVATIDGEGSCALLTELKTVDFK